MIKTENNLFARNLKENHIRSCTKNRSRTWCMISTTHVYTRLRVFYQANKIIVLPIEVLIHIFINGNNTSIGTIPTSIFVIHKVHRTFSFTPTALYIVNSDWDNDSFLYYFIIYNSLRNIFHFASSTKNYVQNIYPFINT